MTNPLWTSASVAYDYAFTKTLEVLGRYKGNIVRKVECDTDIHRDAQGSRYASGDHLLAVNQADWEYFEKHFLETTTV